eukprot:jgi/Hompol1/3825/HPOL_006762-RA
MFNVDQSPSRLRASFSSLVRRWTDNNSVLWTDGEGLFVTTIDNAFHPDSYLANSTVAVAANVGPVWNLHVVRPIADSNGSCQPLHPRAVVVTDKCIHVLAPDTSKNNDLENCPEGSRDRAGNRQGCIASLSIVLTFDKLAPKCRVACSPDGNFIAQFDPKNSFVTVGRLLKD